MNIFAVVGQGGSTRSRTAILVYDKTYALDGLLEPITSQQQAKSFSILFLFNCYCELLNDLRAFYF